MQKAWTPPVRGIVLVAAVLSLFSTAQAYRLTTLNLKGPYDLEVSSPGLDRQLRKDREFRWALGKRVRCWLAGGEEFRGRLADVDDARLTLDRDGERVELPRERVTKARLEAEVPWPRRAAES